MTNIRKLLQEKGGDVFTIGRQATVFEAIKTMADHNIGALVVMEEGKVVGLITERTYAREIVLKGRASPTTPVGDVMDTSLTYAMPEQSVEECMAVMTEMRLRHLPVIEHGRLIGLISQGDLVKSIIAEREFTIEQLVHYIHH